MRTVFIQANHKQLLGARLAEFAIKRNLRKPDSVAIHIMNVDEMPLFQGWRTGDLQSFTLSRFMPPGLMNYRGQAIVIDPDIFALTDVTGLFAIDMGASAILACRKKGSWDTSVMRLDCARLTHWSVANMLADLTSGKRQYADIISLAHEPAVGTLSRTWNSLDHLDEHTKMLHTTMRITQPWKTGLPIDFYRKPLGKIGGIIPREPLLRLLGRYPTAYQPHPNKNIERFFFRLLKDALIEGTITENEVQQEISRKNVRHDLLECARAA